MPPRQTVVNVQPGVGVAGDFASTNPRFTADFGPGGAVAGIGGCTVGLFAWAGPPTDADGANASITNSGSGPVVGFIAREQQGLITQYLQDAGMTIPAGFMVTVFTGGDFFVVNAGTTPAIPGEKAYANFSGGAATFANTGSPTAGGTSTASTVAAQTSAFTGGVLGDVLTVSAVSSGFIVPGEVLTATGLIVGTTVASQLSGAPNGVGTYLLSNTQATIAPGAAFTGTWGLLTIGGTVGGTGGYPLGAVIGGGTVAAGSTITANATNGSGVPLTGTGGAGTYATQTQTVASAAINTSALNVETKWFCRSYGAPGSLVKISDHAYG